MSPGLILVERVLLTEFFWGEAHIRGGLADRWCFAFRNKLEKIV